MLRNSDTGTLDRSAVDRELDADASGSVGNRAVGWPSAERRSPTGRQSSDVASSTGPAAGNGRLPAPTAVIVAATGAAGVAGLLALERSGRLDPSASLVALVAVVTTAVLVEALRRALDAAAMARTEVDRVRRRADRDPVTGLATRPAITAELARRLEERQPGEVVAALVCELEHFRRINDTAGHAVGDELLRRAAGCLVHALRPTEAVGRLGADQYLIVTSGLPAIRDLEILAERLVDVLDRPMTLADGTIQVIGGRVGVAFAVGERHQGDVESAPSMDACGLLADASLARSRAREDGRRWAVADRADRAEAVERQALEHDLRAAIADRQLTAHYQPVVDVATGRVDRLEALVRWRHGERGTLLPAQFLPVAADAGLMGALDGLVLEQACRQAVAWSAAAGRPIAVAVNVSVGQLLDGGLVDAVRNALADSGLPAAQLQLELAAGPLLERLDRSIVVLRQLELLGVEFAIDDLGLGAVDPARLRALTMVSTLKVDRTLVAGIDGDPVAAKVVGAVIALAAALDLAVVAEGVETAAQARALAELGADRLQGYLFARPGPGSAITATLDVDHRHTW